MKYQAVIFDLFGTLVDNFSFQEHKGVLSEMAMVLSAPSKEFTEKWIKTMHERVIGTYKSPEENIEFICKELGLSPEDEAVNSAGKIRRDYTRRTVIPRNDAVDTLARLRSAGCKTGLITDCSAEVPILWKETQFASLIDVTVFSCLVGLRKPDPRIYELACERLEVLPQNCLYVGDGSNHELTGALKVGMAPVLIRVPYEENKDAYRINAEEWDGKVISSLIKVLDLVE